MFFSWTKTTNAIEEWSCEGSVGGLLDAAIEFQPREQISVGDVLDGLSSECSICSSLWIGVDLDRDSKLDGSRASIGDLGNLCFRAEWCERRRYRLCGDQISAHMGCSPSEPM